MIIQMEGATAEDTGRARRSLEELARSWGEEIKDTHVEPSASGITRHGDGKVIDPVALATLVVSIPSAALAAVDLADRIRKRRRAGELIDHAQHLAEQQVNIYLIAPGRTVEFRTLTPDQLLDLLPADHPAS
jgi:3-methyladenine DNA glycosylase/8-oxoguanine DNA glycosylase